MKCIMALILTLLLAVVWPIALLCGDIVLCGLTLFVTCMAFASVGSLQSN